MVDECKHTRKFCKSLIAQGGMTYPNVGSRFVPRGWPDRTVVCPWGGIILLECKSEFGKLRSEQLEQLTKLHGLGAPAWVLRFQDTRPFPISLENHFGTPLTDYIPWSKFFDAIRTLLELRSAEARADAVWGNPGPNPPESQIH